MTQFYAFGLMTRETMLKILSKLLTALVCIVWAQTTSFADELKPVKEYRTGCLELYERTLADGHFAYISALEGEHGHFNRFDILTGECSRAGNLLTNEFRPIAFSDEYIFASDGLYNRHSVYRKYDGTKIGSIRFSHPILSAHLTADRLFALQFLNNDYPPQLMITAFSIPDLKLVSKTPVKTDQSGVDQYRALFKDDQILLDVRGQIRAFNYNGLDIPYPRNNAMIDQSGDSCPSELFLLSPEKLLVRENCKSYRSFDSKVLAWGPEFQLIEGYNFVTPILVGKTLHLLEESNGSESRNNRMLSFDIDSGRELRDQGIVHVEGYTYKFVIGSKLVLAGREPSDRNFRVRIFDLLGISDTK